MYARELLSHDVFTESLLNYFTPDYKLRIDKMVLLNFETVISLFVTIQQDRLTFPQKNQTFSTEAEQNQLR